MAILVIAWLICGGIGVYVADSKGRHAAEGAALGFLLGPLGILIVALLPTVGKPAFAEQVAKHKAALGRAPFTPPSLNPAIAPPSLGPMATPPTPEPEFPRAVETELSRAMNMAAARDEDSRAIRPTP